MTESRTFVESIIRAFFSSASKLDTDPLMDCCIFFALIQHALLSFANHDSPLLIFTLHITIVFLCRMSQIEYLLRSDLTWAITWYRGLITYGQLTGMSALWFCANSMPIPLLWPPEDTFPIVNRTDPRLYSAPESLLTRGRRTSKKKTKITLWRGVHSPGTHTSDHIIRSQIPAATSYNRPPQSRC